MLLVTFIVVLLLAVVSVAATIMVANAMVEPTNNDANQSELFEDGVNVVEPKHGTVTVWKAVDRGIAKLRLPIGARVVTPRGRDKMRTDEVIVKGIINLRTPTFDDETSSAWSLHETMENGIHYVEGARRRSVLNESVDIECTKGIHFYETREEAAKHFKNYA